MALTDGHHNLQVEEATDGYQRLQVAAAAVSWMLVSVLFASKDVACYSQPETMDVGIRGECPPARHASERGHWQAGLCVEAAGSGASEREGRPCRAQGHEGREAVHEGDHCLRW